MYFGLPLFPLYEHVEASALQLQILKHLQGWRGWRILFISHKIVIRVVTLLPGREDFFSKVCGKYPKPTEWCWAHGCLEDVEEFVCRLYKSEVVESGVNKARARMFHQVKVALEMLPPTQDALELHLSRANDQANVWLQADKVEMNVNPPTSVLGWQGTWKCPF